MLETKQAFLLTAPNLDTAEVVGAPPSHYGECWLRQTCKNEAFSFTGKGYVRKLSGGSGFFVNLTVPRAFLRI